jgi:hypothetical protein
MNQALYAHMNNKRKRKKKDNKDSETRADIICHIRINNM